MTKIPLTQGKFAMVDDADYDAMSAHKWCAHKKGQGFYAVRNIHKPDGSWATQSMHSFLMPGIPEIDHHDGNGLNNQRYNLRPATHQQNLRGFRRKGPKASSKFRGVHWYKKTLKWCAHIRVDGKQVNLGYFTDETRAAHAYDSAAVFYFGEWASTNFDIGEIRVTL